MINKLEEFINVYKEKYDIKEKRNSNSIFLVIHDDGCEYIQEADDYDLYGLDSCNGHIAGDNLQSGNYKAIIKLI
ncbi:MAG: hypothetical protein J6A89_04190 [Clostridia bacterium]|nr:hypothetical protein [Clostridia bacterium]